MKLINLIPNYEDNIVARVIINAIPYIGGSLDVALSTKWSQYHSARKDDFLAKLQIELSDLKEQVVDKAFLESEKFYDLVHQIAAKAASSRCPETRTGYAKVIKSAIIKDEAIMDLEMLVRQISDLQERDILFMRRVKKLFDSEKDVNGNALSLELNDYGYSSIECELQLYRFENLGLLDHPRNMINGRGQMCFRKIPLFDKITKYLDI